MILTLCGLQEVFAAIDNYPKQNILFLGPGVRDQNPFDGFRVHGSAFYAMNRKDVLADKVNLAVHETVDGILQ